MHYRLSPEAAGFEPCLLEIRSYFEQTDATIHRARNVLKTITLCGRDTVVKSFRIPHLLNRLIYTFVRRSKAQASFENAMRLRELGIGTPAPVGYILFFKGGLLRESFFVAERFVYDYTIREVLLDPDFGDRGAFFRAFARFTAKLHEKGVWHRDYSPGNILVAEAEGTYSFSLVDINRMRFAPVPPEEGLRNFDKLWADPADMEVMAGEYARVRGMEPEKAIKAAIGFDAANKARKNAKKRLKKALGRKY